MIRIDMVHIDEETAFQTAAMLLKHYPPPDPVTVQWVEAVRVFGYRLLKRSDGDPDIKTKGEFYFMRSV